MKSINEIITEINADANNQNIKKMVGLWCNKITKELKGDFDGDIPWNQKYNKSTKIKLYKKATVLPENKEQIICMIFDDIDDLEEYLK